MRFSDPLYLLLLIPVLIGLALSYRKVRGMMRARKAFSFTVRGLIVVLLVFALAGLEAYRPNRGMCTIFLVDRSDSIRDADRALQEQFINQAAAKMNPDDVAGEIVFGGDAAIEQAPSSQFRPDRILSVVDGSATDISSAIRLACASFPDGKSKRVVLLSDGNETSGDAQEAAEAANSEDIPIDYVPLGCTQTGEVAVDDLLAPSETQLGQPFQLKVLAESDIATEGLLTLDRDGVEVKRMEVTLAPGTNTFTMDQAIDQPGFHKFRAILDAKGDHDVRNNIGIGFVSVKGKPRVLVLQENPSDQVLASTLAKQQISVDLRGPGAIPSTADQFQAYDAVILNDLNAESMTPQQMMLLRGAVRDTGVGLAMVGGENSFLPGGWYGTPIADALPVSLDLKKRESFPSTSVLIICDTSGSMGMIEDGVQKVKLAAKAAALTIESLPANTRAGVVASTDGIEFVAPMQELNNKPAMVEQIMRMDVGGGGIYAKPSMDFAITHLEAENTKVRHLILMADGSDVDLRDGCYEEAEKMRAEHITTSTVAIGAGQYVPFLKGLAAVGGGRFYLALKGSQLPAVFTQDAALVARSAIEEGAFLPKVSMGDEILHGIDPDTIPPLLAYDLTDSKPLSQVGMKTQKDDPLLATWQYGLGSSLAFTSDAKSRWAARWMGWSGFATFWAQAIRDITRRSSSNRYQVSSHLEGRRGIVDLKATDESGSPLNSMAAKVRVSAPDGTASSLDLNQTAPGAYSASFAANQIGSYIVTIAEPGAGGKMRISSSGFSLPYPPEYRAFRPNLPLLQSVAFTTGGKELAAGADSFRGATRPGYSIQELWPLLLMISAFLLPLDVAARRIALPIAEIWAKVLAWLRSLKREPSMAPIPHTEVAARLQRAKVRATPIPSPSPSPTAPIANHSRANNPAPSTGGTASEAKPATPAGATSKLLEAKRKRKEG